jgi:hypothetical protein
MSSRGCTLVVAVLAFATARSAAFVTKPADPREMERDNWAAKVQAAWPNPISFRDVVTEPSLWKGPIVPTIFHFSYWVWPSSESILVANALAFAFAAGMLHRVFTLFGHPLAATAAVVCWMAMPQHHLLFGHYFSEPLVAALSALPFSLLLLRPNWAVRIGMLMGVLLLARPPFLLVVVLVPFVNWFLARGTSQNRFAWATRYTLGTLLTFLPWGIRNLLVIGSFVPFTVEGGQTLFHGSYLAVDEPRWQVFHELPEVKALLADAPSEPVARMQYLSGLAKSQVLADPFGQAVRCVRKSLRFWVYLQSDSWRVDWKTATMTLILFVGASVALWRERTPIVVWSLTWVFGLWAMHSVVFGAMRYNFPVMPLMMFAAASAIWPPKPISCIRHEREPHRHDDESRPHASPRV